MGRHSLCGALALLTGDAWCLTPQVSQLDLLPQSGWAVAPSSAAASLDLPMTLHPGGQVRPTDRPGAARHKARYAGFEQVH